MSSRTSVAVEIVSAVAVVISLIFVGFEIRNSTKQTEQNTQALRVAAYQELVGRIVDINILQIEHPDLFRGLTDAVETSSQARTNLNSVFWIFLRHGDMAYFQYQAGVLDEERLRSSLGPVISILLTPYGRDRWLEIRENFVPEYRAYIDQLIADASKMED